jgi:hypothetical protein
MKSINGGKGHFTDKPDMDDLVPIVLEFFFRVSLYCGFAQ